MSIIIRLISLVVLALSAFLGAMLCRAQSDTALGFNALYGMLVVRTNGSGTVTPDYNHQQLVIGRSYSVSAIGQNGYVFSNWTTALVPELRLVAPDNHGIRTNGSNLILHASAHLPLVIEYSSNLVQWMSLPSSPLNGSDVEIVDPGARGAAMRFYRARSQSVTNSPTITFTMQSNLVLTARFCDVQAPAVAFAAPMAGQRISNEVATVRGTARDNTAVVAVWYQLNNGVWEQAFGTTNWSAAVCLPPGPHTMRACAVDPAGNRSPTNQVTFKCILSAQLGLLTNGVGSIARNFTGSLLPVGNLYTVTAVPGDDQIFVGWSGTLNAFSNPLTFTMQTNMSLQANFVPNPFIALQGSYNGLFHPADMMGGITGWADATNSGFFKVTLAANGEFGGELMLEGASRPFSGALDLALQAQVIVPLPNHPPVTLNLQLDPESRSIAGTVEQTPHWISTLFARRAASGNSNAFAGTYTLILEGCDSGSCFIGDPTPLGDSPATIKVTPTGAIEMSGTLADGMPISQSTTVSPDGFWPLYVAPYQGKGMVIGWFNFAEYAGVSIVVWQKAPTPSDDHNYPNGFSTSRVGLVRPYLPPLPGHNAVNFTNGTVEINSGNLAPGIRLTNEVSIINNKLQAQSGGITNLTLAITPSNGLFRGTFLDPVTGKLTSFSGAVMQSSPEWFSTASGGWFLGTNSSGTIRLHPRR